MTQLTAIKQSAPQKISFAFQETPKQERITKYNKPHMIIPAEDMEWALQQRAPVLKLWNECWLSDPYGSRWMPLKTSMKRESFKKAKKPLIEAGLFLFKCEMTVVDGVRHYEWYLKNSHGSRSTYWQLKRGTANPEVSIDHPDPEEDTQPQTEDIQVGTHNLEVGIDNPPAKTEDTQARIENTQPRIKSTEVGTVSTTQQPSNPLIKAVSERLSISSVTLHNLFSNVSLAAKEQFLEFCLKEMAKEKFEIHHPAAWIAAHFKEYWGKFHQCVGEGVAPSQDWANHPKKDEWLKEMRLGRPRFVALGGPQEEWEIRRQFAKWAEANNLVWGDKS